VSERTQLSAEHLEAWRAFLKAHAAVTWRIEEDLGRERDALPLAWYDVLIALERSAQRRLRMFELADAVVLSRTNLTRRVDRLAVAGLLRREPAATDRRGAFAVITDAGRDALRRTWPLYAGSIASRFARHMSAEEAGVLRTVLERVLAAARSEPRAGNGAETRR
jgi:DNA-binding MarR family transcriptional regulator